MNFKEEGSYIDSPDWMKKVNFLMIPNRKGWHYLGVRKSICFIKRNNSKTLQSFLLFEFLLFFYNKKQT